MDKDIRREIKDKIIQDPMAQVTNSEDL